MIGDYSYQIWQWLQNSGLDTVPELLEELIEVVSLKEGSYILPLWFLTWLGFSITKGRKAE